MKKNKPEGHAKTPNDHTVGDRIFGYIYNVTTPEGDDYDFHEMPADFEPGDERFYTHQSITKGRYANLCNNVNLRLGRRRFTWIYFLLAIISLVGFTISLLAHGSHVSLDTYIFLGLMVLFSGKAVFHPSFDIGRFKRRWERHPIFKSGYILRLYDGGILLENKKAAEAGGRVFIPFGGFESLYSTNEYHLFVLHAKSALFVPLQRSELSEEHEKFIGEIDIKRIEK